MKKLLTKTARLLSSDDYCGWRCSQLVENPVWIHDGSLDCFRMKRDTFAFDQSPIFKQWFYYNNHRQISVLPQEKDVFALDQSLIFIENNAFTTITKFSHTHTNLERHFYSVHSTDSGKQGTSSNSKRQSVQRIRFNST